MDVKDRMTPGLRAQLLSREYELVADHREQLKGIFVEPTNVFEEWTGVIIIDTATNPYKGGVFRFRIIFPEAYPFHKPRCKFLSELYHPAVSPTTGEADLGAWYESLTPFQDSIALHCLLNVKALFSDFEPRDNPLNLQANALAGTDRLFAERASRCAQQAEMSFTSINATAVDAITGLLKERESEQQSSDENCGYCSGYQPALEWFRASLLE
eukprot:gene12442-19239_t